MHKQYNQIFAFVAIIIVLFGLLKPRKEAQVSILNKNNERLNNLNKRVKEAETEFVDNERVARLGGIS